MKILKEENTLTRQELAKRMGVSAPTIQRELDTLKSLGILEREGGKTYGYWGGNQVRGGVPFLQNLAVMIISVHTIIKKSKINF